MLQTDNPVSDQKPGLSSEAAEPPTVSRTVAVAAAAGLSVAFLLIGLVLGSRIFGGDETPVSAPSPPAPSPPALGGATSQADVWVDGSIKDAEQLAQLDRRSCMDALDAAQGRSRDSDGNIVFDPATRVEQADWPFADPETDMCTTHGSGSSFATPLSSQQGSFLLVSDFGRNGFCCQMDVATEMAFAARAMGANGVNFIVNGGDAFYETGLQHEDDRQVATSWRDIYIERHPELDKTWYGVLGNHDYQGRVSAQVLLTYAENRPHSHPRWKLGRADSTVREGADVPPRDRYYSVVEELGSVQVLLVFIDSNPFQPQYYDDIDNGFGVAGDGDYSAEDGVRAVGDEDRQEQLRWLEDTLDSHQDVDYTIVVGHHPMYVSNEHETRTLQSFQQQVEPILRNRNVHAYLSGHDHTMQHHQMHGVDYFVAGTGSRIGSVAGPSHGSRFSLARSGFLLARFAPTYMTCTFIDYAGDYLYEVQIPQTKSAGYGMEGNVDPSSQGR